MTHWEKFSRAYLIGGLFVIVQVFTAIVGEFSDMKPEDLAKMTDFQWFIHWSAVIVSAGTVILAFLSKAGQGEPGTATQPPP